MNVYEVLYEFDRLLETVDPKFKTESSIDADTKLMMFNVAQTRYLYNKYLNKATFDENIESIQKNSGDLRELIIRETVTPTAIASGPFLNIGYTLTLSSLSSNYLYYIRSDSYVTRTQPTSITGWTDNKVVESYTDVSSIISNLYNKPILLQPVIFFENSSTAVIIVDSYTTIDTNNPTVSLTYLRTPKYLALNASSTTVTTCELANYNHEEIVRLAVDIYLKEYKYMLQTKQN